MGANHPVGLIDHKDVVAEELPTAPYKLGRKARLASSALRHDGHDPCRALHGARVDRLVAVSERS